MELVVSGDLLVEGTSTLNQRLTVRDNGFFTGFFRVGALNGVGFNVLEIAQVNQDLVVLGTATGKRKVIATAGTDPSLTAADSGALVLMTGATHTVALPAAPPTGTTFVLQVGDAQSYAVAATQTMIVRKVDGTLTQGTSFTTTAAQQNESLELTFDGTSWRSVYRSALGPPSTFAWRAIYLGYDNAETIDVQIRNCVEWGYNLIILAFYQQNILGPDPFSGLDKWAGLTDTVKTSLLAEAHAAGASIVLSAGGAGETAPYDFDPTTYANGACNYALAQRLDGVDLDLEHVSPGFVVGAPMVPKTSAQLLTWISTCVRQCRTVLTDTRLISSAPQSPYFGPVGSATAWAGTSGGYTQVYLDNPTLWDLFNIQYYNQTTQYLTYAAIFTEGPLDFPETAVKQIGENGPIPLSKLVVGTFLQTAAQAVSGSADGTNLNNDPAVWRTQFTQALSDFQWNGGGMVWQYHPTSLNDGPTAQTWVHTIFFP